MATQWYYQDAGEERGPVAFRELVELVRSGTVTETDLVRSSWKTDWQRADSVVGLFHMAGRSAEELAQLNPPVPPPSTPEPIAAESPADVAALGADEATERPGWMTRLSSITGHRKQRSSEIPIAGTASAGDPAVKSTRDAGEMQVAATSSTEELSPELSGYYSRPASSTGNDAWTSAVEEAVARADLRAAGLKPPVGRWARLARRITSPFSAMRGTGRSSWLRPAFRLVSAIVCANLMALAIVEWSAEEDLRFPVRETTRGQDTGARYFPFVGRCGSGEYLFLVFDVMLVTGAAGYFAAQWFDSRTE